MALADLIAPAIKLAEQGLVVSTDLSESLEGLKERFEPWPESLKIFFKDGGAAYVPGDTLVQTDLAASLKAIAEQGPKAFYEGDIAQ
jgi:gamma-glutamyltranspeptidase/glutathione hydrolase